ncbi:MAG: hypothetical protein O2854_01045 [Chloroflexi bacterium]|nr:hypothetical protein [Chloroflexota bacterium]
MNVSEIVNELESLAESGTRVPGMRRKVMVDIDKLSDISASLKDAVPASVKEAHETLKQKDSLINLAMMEAKRIKEGAQAEAKSITENANKVYASKVDETEIIKAAEAKAREITDHALQQANEVVQEAQRRSNRANDAVDAEAVSRRAGADQYAREVLFGLEERLSQLLGQVRRGIDSLGLETSKTASKS